MTTPEEIEPQSIEEPVSEAENLGESADVDEEEQDERKRRSLLILLLLLLLCLCCVGGLFMRYILKPQPLPEMLLPTQVGGACYPPAYKFSITDVSGPVAVAVSPDNERIYVAEGAGDRRVKVFDFDGHLLKSFAPPGTDNANREPKYMAVDATGRVFLVDRTSSAIDIYDPDGNFIDAIIGQQLTLTKYLKNKLGTLPPGIRIIRYEGINKFLTYLVPGESQKTIKVTFDENTPDWSPLGLRFDTAGNLMYSDVTSGFHSINIIPAADLNGDLSAFAPSISHFGSEGFQNDQFSFPQTVVLDGRGNFYVADGNNSRISVWTPDMKYKTFFAYGSNVGALNLPRGMWMGKRDCLHVADAVGSVIRVYDVAGEEPSFAFEIGGFGVSEGMFNYPIDIVLDGTGRLYVADRDNNRIQVWSY